MPVMLPASAFRPDHSPGYLRRFLVGAFLPRLTKGLPFHSSFGYRLLARFKSARLCEALTQWDEL